MKKYTFGDLGFEGIANIAPMEINRDTKQIAYVEIAKDNEPIYKKFLIPELMRYNQRQEIKGERAGFIAAVAYFMDGRIEYAYNEAKNHHFVVTGGVFESNHYTVSDLINCKSNVEYAKTTFLLRNPEGLMLYQEIPGDEQHYVFRIVHNDPCDIVEDPEKLLAVNERLLKKLALIDYAFDYVQMFKKCKTLNEAEVDEIAVIMDMLVKLDPKGRYIKSRAEKLLAAGVENMYEEQEKSTVILDFRGHKD